MHSVDILYPMFSLVALTFVVLAQIPIARFRAGFAGKVKTSDLRLGESPDVPDRVRLPNRNYMNPLELPVLLYVGCLALYVTDRGDTTMVTLAWAYVGLRALHSFIHLTYNNVIPRLSAFAISNFVLATLWVRFFVLL